MNCFQLIIKEFIVQTMFVICESYLINDNKARTYLSTSDQQRFSAPFWDENC